MLLDPQETIFSKMDITYNEFRKKEYPIELIKDYYKKHILPNEYIWWLEQDKTSPLKIKFLNSIHPPEKLAYILQGLVAFPEMLGNSSSKYQNFIVYLLQEHSIICSNIRDMFSAGGNFTYSNNDIILHKVPKIYKLIVDNKNDFITHIHEYYKSPKIANPVAYWIDRALEYSLSAYEHSRKLLSDILLK
ncbi:MAG: hypothetical protein LBF38_04705 [Deltaproteobacteria bacterium]|nr:hypothetical protein [Deltaproteobacteria bacterium]